MYEHILLTCVSYFSATGLELGGKDPAYVRHDADIDYTVEQLVDGSFFNSGQCCCAIERIYVHEKVYEEFIQKFVDLTKVMIHLFFCSFKFVEIICLNVIY